jgi:polyferredoxin
MNKEVEPSRSDYKWLRSVWIGLTIFFTVVLGFRLFQWLRGAERLDAILVPVVFILMGLAHIFQLKGVAQKVVLVISMLLAILAVLLLIIR